MISSLTGLREVRRRYEGVRQRGLEEKRCGTEDSVSVCAFVFKEFAWDQTIFEPLKYRFVRVMWELVGVKGY